MKVAGHDGMLLMFAPDVWFRSEQFSRFVGPPFVVNSKLTKAIQTCIGHASKAELLVSVANRIRLTLTEDIKELEENGYSPVTRSKEFAAIIETIVCELYSILDGIRLTIFELYPDVRAMQNKSTNEFFKRAANKRYGEDFPPEINNILANAYDIWFLRLRDFRAHVTHGGVGNCHLDRDKNMVSYVNVTMGSDDSARVIENIEELVQEFLKNVFGLQDAIFSYLYKQLEPRETDQFCGMYKGRMYQRTVIAGTDLDRNSGTCKSMAWFENEQVFRCPLADICKPYKLAREKDL